MGLDGRERIPAAMELEGREGSEPDISTSAELSNVMTQIELEERRAQHVRLGRKTSIGGLGLLRAPSMRFEEVAEEKEERSRGVPSAKLSIKEGIRLPVLGEVKWVDLRRDAWKWLHSPLNLLLLLWMILVVVSGALLFLVMTGMLNAVIPDKDARNTWFEVNNQVINGLFTIMCIILQPARLRYAIRLAQWTPEDILVMRATFNKDADRKRHEWKHMLVVVTLLNLNCLFQYALAGFNWGYTRAERPPFAVAVFLTGAIACGAAAGIYNALCPLGKDTPTSLLIQEDADLERGESARKILHGRAAQLVLQDPVASPQWQGGVITGFCQNARVAFLSTLCCLCVFGINQERLGFGNKYVHMITFSLFLFAPFLIFDLAAINVNDTTTRQAIGLAGIIISLFGVLYGGYWRWKMRVTYKIPKSRWCFGHSACTDLTTWVICSCCALAQEVRTAEHYEPVDGKLYSRDGAILDDDIHKHGAHTKGLEPIASMTEMESLDDMEAPKPVIMEAPVDYREAAVYAQPYRSDSDVDSKGLPKFSTPSAPGPDFHRGGD